MNSVRIKMFIALIVALIVSSNSQAQGSYQNSSYQYNQIVPLSTFPSSGVFIALPSAFNNIPHRNINSANLLLKLDLGSTYLYGTGSAVSFNYKVTFTLKAYNSLIPGASGGQEVPNVFDQSSYSLNIQNNQPEAAFNKNFTALASISNSNTTDFSFNTIQISNVTITPAGSSTITSQMQFEISYNINYGLDVTTSSIPVVTITSQQPFVPQKQITFQWSNNGYQFPDYEFQLLRLYNFSPSTASLETNINAVIDWSKALKIETESNATSLTITMAEGEGFYVWRVRPIGTYYPGGIANNLNYSNASWSSSPPTNTTQQINLTLTATGSGANTSYSISTNSNSVYSIVNNPNPFFFYDEVDDTKNWIYSRTFTEGNRISEEINYSNTLQQEKQSQSYLPSKDTTLISQTIPDKTGRLSLKTLPAPVEGGIVGYQSNMVNTQAVTSGTGTGTTNTTGHLYTSDDYDTDNNYRTPTQADESATNYKYYSNNNPDLRVPDAQGYPYSRTLYYNDGTGRVMEQSGVGQTQMINDPTSTSTTGGGGKTVKTYYGSASNTELVSLFGDEAPDNEAVMKTITVDENNTASVTYTSKEGHVIATALSFQDNDNTNTFSPLSNEPSSTPYAVNDTVTQNIQIDSFFLSTKRIVLLQTSPLNINYTVGCPTLTTACGSPTLNCNYQVQVLIHCVDHPNQSILNLQTSSVSCSSSTATWNVPNLLPGTYVIEKKIYTSGGGVSANSVSTTSENYIMPLVNLIKGWLAAINCPADLANFYNNQLPMLQTNLNNLAGYSNSSTQVASFENTYSLPSTFVYVDQTMSIYPATGTPQKVTLTNPSCNCTIAVPVTYTPLFQCPANFDTVDVNGNTFTEINADFFNSPQNTEFFPDLEGYAIALLRLSGCLPNDTAQAAQIFYANYMTGWDRRGDFNRMVYYMLTDQYNCSVGTQAFQSGSTANNGATAPVSATDACGNTTNNTPGITCTGNLCTQYMCSDIANCWLKQILQLQNFICNSDVQLPNPINPANSVDNESEGNQSVFNDQFDNNSGDGNMHLSRRKKKKLQKKLSQIMRQGVSAQAPQLTYTQHIVHDFLQCTGQNFAKILVPDDPCPLTEDANPASNYAIALNSSADPNLNQLTVTQPTCSTCTSTTTNTCKKRTYTPGYRNFSSQMYPPTAAYGANVQTPIPTQKSLAQMFYGVQDPVYAFKYFVYDRGFPELEANSCYSDPNDCYLMQGGQIVIQNGQPVKVPCCATNASTGTFSIVTGSASACGETVPNVTINPNYDSDNSGSNDSKVYTNFCNVGQIVCPYTHEQWGCSERNSFYTQCTNYISTASFASSYYQPPPAPPNQPQCSDFTSIVTDINSDADTLTGTGWNMSELNNWAAWTNQSSSNIGTSAFNYPSATQYDMTSMTQSCLNTCQQRKATFRERLLQVLQDRCYVIDGCKQNTDDNVIYSTDIDAIVDQMFGACTTQCPITTFYCATSQCRYANHELTNLGSDESDINLTYGVASSADVSNNGLCPNGDCSTVTDLTLLTNCQLDLWTMASDWDFDIDLPTKCTNNPTYTMPMFDCVSPANTDPCTTVPQMPSSTALPTSNTTGIPPVTSIPIPLSVSAPGN